MGIRNRDGALYWATGIDNSGLKKGKAEAKGILKTLAREVTGFDVFAGIGVGAALAFAKMTKEAYTFSRDFQLAMKEVQTISRATQQDYDGMSGALLKMSREVPDSAIELSRALYQIVSAGYDGAQGLMVLEAASKGAVAGVTNTTVAADGLTTILNAWKLEVTDVNRVNDIMFKTVELGKVTYDEIAASISQVAPLAAASGISFEQIGSAIATLTKQGTPAAQAVTQIRSAIISMNEQLGTGWSETKTLQQGFEALRDKADQTGQQLREVTGRVEGALAVLATTGDNARGAAEDIRSIGDAAGSTDKAFKIMVESTDEQMKILSNNLKERLKPFGDWITLNMGRAASDINKSMKASAEARDKAIIAGIKREITIIEVSLKTLDNPIDSFFRGKEKTEKVRKELQDRLKLLKHDLQESQKELSTPPPEGPPSISFVDPVEFQKQLDASKQAYEEHQMLVTTGFKKEADTFYWTQLEMGNTYKQYLQNQLKAYEHDIEARKLIYLELSKVIQKETEDQKNAEEAAFEPMSKRLEALRKMTELINAGSAANNLTGSETPKKTTGKTPNALTDEMLQKVSRTLTVIGSVQSHSEKVQRTWENIIEDITNPEVWSTASAGIREMSYVIAGTNQEMSQMLSGVSNIMDGITGALTKGASPQAVLQSTIQAIAGVIQIFQSARAYAKTFDDVLQDMNRDLERQQRILDLAQRKGGADSAYQGNLDSLNKQKAALEEVVALGEAQVKQAEKMGFFGRLVSGVSLKKLQEELKKYQNQLEDINNQIQDLGQSWTDFNAGLVTELDLADKIAEAFQEGKASAADFANYVNDIMRDAVLEVFKASVLGPQLTKAQEYLASALNDKQLTDTEIAQFQDLFTAAAENSKAIWEKLTSGLDMNSSTTDPNSLSGSIRASLTEETGSILAGTMNAMRLDLRELVNLQLDAISTLLAIEVNTNNLIAIRQDLSSIKNSFQNVGK